MSRYNFLGKFFIDTRLFPWHSTIMKLEIKKAAEVIKKSKNLIALTGAGISVESGIPDFRSAGGLWDKYDPAVYATIEAFHKMPGKVWEMIFDMIELTTSAGPNPGHIAMAELEAMGLLKSIITQNIDNLHQRGGSRNVIEYHGNSSRLVCLRCGSDYGIDEFRIPAREIPVCRACQKILKPSVIFFGEMIPQKALMESQFLADSADAVLVVGTSAVVYPAAGIPETAKENGAVIIEVNLEETVLSGGVTDIFLMGPSGTVLPELLKAVKSL